MRAIEVQHTGGPEVLRLAERPDPAPGAGELLVRVAAAGVNPIDWKLRAGAMSPLHVTLPWIPGCELAGTVVAVGAGVTRFAPGDRVVAMLDPFRGGATAELAVVNEDAAARAPGSFSDAEAAGLLVGGVTALQAFHKANLRAGTRVLVHGAAGGVGHLAIQLARALGAKVTAVCASANVGWVSRLGPDRVIDRTVTDFTQGDERYDVVLDAVGTSTYKAARRVIVAGGTYVTTTVSPRSFVSAALAPLSRRHATWVTTAPVREDIETVARLATDGALRVVLDVVYPWEEIAAAHEHSAAGRARGKIVVSIADERAGYGASGA